MRFVFMQISSSQIERYQETGAGRAAEDLQEIPQRPHETKFVSLPEGNQGRNHAHIAHQGFEGAARRRRCFWVGGHLYRHFQLRIELPLWNYHRRRRVTRWVHPLLTADIWPFFVFYTFYSCTSKY